MCPPPDPNEQVAHELQRVFGVNLKAAREQLHMTQEALALASGSARSYVSLVEQGKQNLMFATAAALARAVGATMIELLSPLGQTPESALSVPSSGVMPPQPGTLAIELPAGQAFEVALIAARHVGKSLPLIEPETREIKGVVPKP